MKNDSVLDENNIMSKFRISEKKETCDIHGEFISKSMFNGKYRTKCPTCSDIESKKKEAEEAAIEEAKRQENWKRKLSRAAIPLRFTEKTLDVYKVENNQQENAFDFAKKFALDFCDGSLNGRSAIFSGGVGTGKTHLSVAIAIEGMNAGRSALFTSVQRIVRDVKSTFKSDCELSENEIIDQLVYPELLIIDEVGVQFGSEFERNVIFDVINQRYENRKSTLFLTNLGAEELKNVLGVRVLDRIKEDGGKFIVFSWESHRI